MEKRPELWLEALPRISSALNIASVACGAAVLLAQAGRFEEASIFIRQSQEILFATGFFFTLVDLFVAAGMPHLLRGLLRKDQLDISRGERLVSMLSAALSYGMEAVTRHL